MSSDKPRLAVGIIVKDEQERLPATLESVAAITELVYVLDTGSSDQTVALAQNLGAAVSETTFKDDFSAVRNELVRAVEADGRADWLLWINAGEQMDTTTVAEFVEFLQNGLESDSAYMMILRRLGSPTGEKHGLDEETIDLRLMPLRKGIQFVGAVKESVLPYVSMLMLRTNAAPGRILCPPKYQDQGRRQNRARQTIRILDALEHQGKPMEDEYLLARAEAQEELGDAVSARLDYTKLFEETTKTNLRLEAVYGIWSTFGAAPIAPNDMTKVLLAGINYFPVDMQLLTFMGAHLQRLGRLDLAIRTFETAVRFGRISLDVWHRLHLCEQAVTNLAFVYRLLGNGWEAIRVMESNLDFMDARSEFGRHLLELYIAELQEQKAHDFLGTILKGGELDSMRKVVTGACRATAGAWEAAVIPLEDAYLNGCRDVLGLRWYALTLLSMGRFTEAVRILDDWLRIDPNNPEASAFHFAAMHPERFNEIMGQIWTAQMRSQGVETEPAPSYEAAVEAKEAKSAMRDAVHDMVGSSGISTEKISVGSPLGMKLKNSGFDFDAFEFESADSNADVVFRASETAPPF